MSKPRIIIADCDEGYLIPLQSKFIEEYFEKIDLEIITDPQYFRQLFSTPQNADVMILSEAMYDRSLQRHNIGHTFLMTEQYHEDSSADATLCRIFKYTSIKEVFNEISSKSADVLRSNRTTPQSTQVVLVSSACGGTGKTTVALGISAMMAKNYKKVLYISAARLHSFQYLLKSSAPITATDVYAKLATAGKTIYQDIRHCIRKELFHYLPPFKASLLSVGLDYGIYEKLIRSAKESGEYEYIVVDTDVAFDESLANLFDLADKVLVVTTQSASAVCATNALVANVNGMHTDKYTFLCNDFFEDRYNALIDPRFTPKFTISDYVHHIPGCDPMTMENLTAERSLQRAAFLII